MAKYVWITDTHFNVRENSLIADLKLIENAMNQESADGLILSGDISVASKLVSQLGTLEQAVKKPIYFTLGNHDFWGTSYENVDKVMKDLTLMSPFLKYLPASEYLQLGTSTCVIGANTWYDAIIGRPNDSMFIMRDWLEMKDYINALEGDVIKSSIMTHEQKRKIIEVSRNLSRNAVDKIVSGIKAAKRNNIINMIIVSHIPPYRDVCMYNNKLSDELHLPWYTSKLLGDALSTAAAQLPECNFTVLCGHTHSYAEKRMEKNLLVIAGQGDYDSIAVSGIIRA